jgi:hypothetical protein
MGKLAAITEEPLMLDGQPMDFAAIRPMFRRIAAWLDEQPTNQLFSADELSEKSAIGADSIARFAKVESFTHYCHRKTSGRPELYYGNPRAIERLRAKFAERT